MDPKDYYMSASEIAELYNVSDSTARRLMERVYIYFQVDKNRIIKRGRIPRHLVEKYLSL